MINELLVNKHTTHRLHGCDAAMLQGEFVHKESYRFYAKDPLAKAIPRS